MLIAAGRTSGGVPGDDIIEFREASFGVFQMQQAGSRAGLDRQDLERALDDLTRHGLVEGGEGGKFILTALGRLAGESAVEVETLTRAIDCLRLLRSEDVTDPALISIAQTSVELDAVYFPVNKRSTHKEPQHWQNELIRQGISRSILAKFGTKHHRTNARYGARQKGHRLPVLCLGHGYGGDQARYGAVREHAGWHGGADSFSCFPDV